MSEQSEKKDRVVVNITLPRAALIIGVVLLATCVTAGFYAAPKILFIVRLITGFYGSLFTLCGVAGVLPWTKWYASRQPANR